MLFLAFKLHQSPQSLSSISFFNINNILLSHDFNACINEVCSVSQAKKLRVQRSESSFTTKKPSFSVVTQNDRNSVFSPTAGDSEMIVSILPTRRIEPTFTQTIVTKLPKKEEVYRITQAPRTDSLMKEEVYRFTQTPLTNAPKKEEVYRFTQTPRANAPKPEGVRHITQKSPTKFQKRELKSPSTKTPATSLPERERPTRTPEPHKYRGTLYFRPSQSGFGNNLYGLISAFVISAISNRRLVGSLSDNCVN